MSYLRSRYGKAPKVAMGDLSSTIGAVVSAVGTVGSIASDPYLPEVTCLVGELSAIKRGQVPTPCAKTQPGLPGGIGLSDAVLPLRAYVYAKQNPWVVPAAIAAIFGVPFLLGYTFGKGA